MSTTVPTLTAALSLGAPLTLEHGGELEHCRIGFRRYGHPGLPLVIVLGGISASRHVTSCTEDPRPGWWESVVGEGRAIDPRQYSVLGIDYLGGPDAGRGTRDEERETTGAAALSAQRADLRPASHVPRPAPCLSTYDQARAIAAVLDRLGVDRAHAIVGASYGGMVALAFAERFPRRLAHAVVISGAHRTHPMATALRSIQRRIVRLGVESGETAAALGIARQLAMTTYRTSDELSERFPDTPEWTVDGPRFPVELWLERAGERFAGTFTAESFLALSESIDLHAVTPEQIHVPITLVAVERDSLVPFGQMRELRDRLPIEPDWYVVESIYGHDAFLKEVDAIAAIIRRALRTPTTPDADVTISPNRLTYLAPACVSGGSAES
ncbi:MAG TPA: alpha/beta fold hydrolase, partial [Gemmatimonadaceae bacterium]|nr:alpha/beta fold hydrolase [Gemmatimonadaceae bacterium]